MTSSTSRAKLKVITYKAGRKWAEDVQRTTGPAAKLLLAADRATVRADGSDLAFVTVTVADKDGCSSRARRTPSSSRSPAR